MTVKASTQSYRDWNTQYHLSLHIFSLFIAFTHLKFRMCVPFFFFNLPKCKVIKTGPETPPECWYREDKGQTTLNHTEILEYTTVFIMIVIICDIFLNV